MIENANQQAFPLQPIWARAEDVPAAPGQYGLTKREDFAARAMQGLIGQVESLGALARDAGCDAEELLAAVSMKAADALLAELDKPKTKK